MQEQGGKEIIVDESTGRALSVKPGVTFSVGRVATFCKNGRYAERIGAGTPIFLSAVLEYLAFEILAAARLQAMKEKKKRISP